MLEQLADHDDELLEQLLMDETPDAARRSSRTSPAKPARTSAFRSCSARATSSWGVRRLLKALRHEAPGPAGRRQPPRRSPTRRMYVFKIAARLDRPAGARPRARRQDRRRLRPQDGRRRARPRSAPCSRCRARRRRRSAKPATATSSPSPRSTPSKPASGSARASCRRPVEIDYPARNCALAIEPADRKDDVKLSGALAAPARGGCRASSSSMTTPTTRSGCAASTTSI